MKKILFIILALISLGVYAQDSTATKIIVDGRIFNVVGNTNAFDTVILNGATSGTATIQAEAESGSAVITLPSSSLNMDDLILDVGANTSKDTNATHTGEVTGSTALTIASGVVDSDNITNLTIVAGDIAADAITESKLDIFNAPTDGYHLGYDSVNGMQWEVDAGGSSGIQLHPDSPVTIDSLYVGTVAQIAAGGLGTDVLAIPTDEVDTLVVTYHLSDFTTVQTASTSVAKYTWRAPYAMTLLDIRGNVTTAGTTSSITMDVHDGATTIMTTNKVVIEATETTSEDATTQPTLTDTAIADNAILTFYIDAVDSGGTGLGYTIQLYYKK